MINLSLTALGASDDARLVANAAMSAASNILTAAAAGFAAADIGKTIVVAGAGAAGAKLRSSIVVVNSATQIVLADAASATVADVGAAWGTDCSAAVQAGLDALDAAEGGTLVYDGTFLQAAPVTKNFLATLRAKRIKLLGMGTVIVAADASDDLYTLGSVDVAVEDIEFVGIPDATYDARRILYFNNCQARVENCRFVGLFLNHAAITNREGLLFSRFCEFGGSFVAPAGDYVRSLVEHENWFSIHDFKSKFIDYGYWRGYLMGKSASGANRGWIGVRDPYDAEGARAQQKVHFVGTMFDEGAIHGVVIEPPARRIQQVHFEATRHNVTPATGGRAMDIRNTDSVRIENARAGWSTSSALFGHYRNCTAVVVDTPVLEEEVDRIEAVDCGSLTLIDAPAALATVTLTRTPLHPVARRFGGYALVKDGMISDSDFVAPPAIGTTALDRLAGRDYVKKRASGGWIYTDPTGGEILGPELLSTNWGSGNNGQVAIVGDRLRVTNVTAYGYASQMVATTAGQTYRIAAKIFAGSAGGLVRVGTGTGTGSYYEAATDGEAIFTALNSQTFVSLLVNSPTAGRYAEFDDVSLKAV